MAKSINKQASKFDSEFISLLCLPDGFGHSLKLIFVSVILIKICSSKYDSKWHWTIWQRVKKKIFISLSLSYPLSIITMFNENCSTHFFQFIYHTLILIAVFTLPFLRSVVLQSSFYALP